MPSNPYEPPQSQLIKQKDPDALTLKVLGKCLLAAIVIIVVGFCILWLLSPKIN